MHARLLDLRAAVATRSPFTVMGSSFDLALWDIETRPLTAGVFLRITAEGPHSRHSSELHVDLDKYSDSEVADFAVRTMTRVIDGGLPQGVSEID